MKHGAGTGEEGQEAVIWHTAQQGTVSTMLSVRQSTPLNLVLPESKLNPRAFHAYVRSKTSIKEEVMALRGEDGTLTASLSETCQLLNKEFEKVFVRDDNQPIPATKEFNGVKLTTCAVTDDVKGHLMNLKVLSAPGSEDVHLVLLKKCAASVCKPLTLIFRESLRTGQVPKDWTRAKVTPIFKKGSRANPLNYRPVSLISVPCKIMKKIIRKIIVNHPEENI